MILLERYAYLASHCEGVLSVDDWECFALERPWLDNRPMRSCIPEGKYRARVSTYNAGGYACVELLNVPGRSQIKVHGANLVDELLGCIAPGMHWGVLKSQRAVLRSRVALEDLLERLPKTRDQHFDFEVRFRSRYGPK